MNIKLIRFFILIFFLASCYGNDLISQVKSADEFSELNAIDGPYVYRLNDSIKTIQVKMPADSVFIVETNLRPDEINEIECEVSNSDFDKFSFALDENYKIPPFEYDAPEKLFITSDIEGNFNAFYSMLVGNGVMDSAFQWTFGVGHLVICGDMFDRGDNVIPALWLLYKLEKEAPKHGGMVHFILGNHDIMQIQMDIRYVHPKYIQLARILSGIDEEKEAYKYLMSEQNELIKWVKSKNAVEKIGRNLYLHGGISPEIVQANLSIPEINDIIRTHMHELLIKEPGEDETANLVFGNQGPFWYRGLVKDYKEYYQKVNEEDVDKILHYFDIDRIIIGHTIIDDKITSDFGGKVIRVDIKHSFDKFNGKHEALFIDGNRYFVVNDLAEKRELSSN